MSAHTAPVGALPPLDRSRAPEPGEPRPFSFPPLERFPLSNGLPVLFAQTAGFPVTTVSVLLDAGGLHEDAAHAGLASLTAALLESGAGERSASQIADELEQLGVQLSTGTSWDAVHMDLTGLSAKVPAATAIMSDLLREPTFPSEEVERLRHEQLAAILQRRAEPRGLANEVAARFVFSPETPFARPLGGLTRSLQAITRDDIVAFHAGCYTPAAATIVIAGELSLDAARGLAEEHFGAWSGPAARPVNVTVEPRSRQPQLVVVHRPGSVQSELRVAHIGVAREDADYFPLVVMNTILGGAFSSRLNLNLRERHGYTYGASSAFVMRRLPGPFLASAAVQTEVTAAALSEILHEIRGIREAPVTQPELEDARNYLAGIFPLRLQTTDGVASRLAELAIYALPLDYFDSYGERVLQVSQEEVLRVAQQRLRPEELAVVIVGDADRIRAPLEELGLGPVQVVEPEEDA